MTRKRKQNLFIDRRRVENVYAKITRLGARIVVLVNLPFAVMISAIKFMSLYTHTHTHTHTHTLSIFYI
jgi:hypothetical protein